MGIYKANSDLFFDSIFQGTFEKQNETKEYKDEIFSVLEEKTTSREIEYMHTSVSRTVSEEIYQQRCILKIANIDV